MPVQTMNLSTDRARAFAYAPQDTAEELADPAAGKLLPFTSAQGIVPNFARIANNESQDTGMTRLGRQGRVSVQTQLTGQLAAGPYDDLFEALLRTTREAEASLTETDLGQVSSVSGRTITLDGSGDPVAAVKRGHVLVFDAGLDAADLGKPLVVTDITGTSLTFAQSLTSASAAATVSATRRASMINGTDYRSFTLEERSANLGGDQTGEVMQHARVGATSISVQPGQNIQVQMALQGIDYLPRVGEGYYFADPVRPTAQPMTEAFARLIFDGVEVAKLSSFSIDINPQIFTPNTTGNRAEELGYGSTTITGSVSVLHDGMAAIEKVIREENVPIGIHIVDPIAGDFTLFMPWAKLMQPSKSNAGADQFSVATYQFEAGQDERGGASDLTMCRMSLGAAA